MSTKKVELVLALNSIPEHKEIEPSLLSKVEKAQLNPRVNGKRSLRSAKDTFRKNRFGRALNKALAARSAKLGRRLSRAEFVRLKQAVGKQLSPQLSQIERKIGNLAETVETLRKSAPVDTQSLQDSIALFATQVSILRSQFLQGQTDSADVTENCSHFRSRKVFNLKSEHKSLYRMVPSLGAIWVENVPSTLHLACDKCVERREDAVFEWTGFCFDSFVEPRFKSEDNRDYVRSGLSSISPLAIPNVWRSVLNRKFHGTS